MESERVELTSQSSGRVFTREQKVGYALVIACGVLAVVFGMFYLVSHLHRPFVIAYTGSRIWTAAEQDEREIAQQKRSDTDDDTVSDYDELYIYGSSPYLADTDSDGLTDDVEIMTNGDPTCAIGDSCEDDSNETYDIDEIMEEQADAAAHEAQSAAEKARQIQDMLTNLSVGEIRSILIESGADRVAIEAMTDEEIQTLYQQVIKQLEESGGLDEFVNAATEVTTSAP